MLTEDTRSFDQKLYQFIERLYPIYRSITGNGVRETLSIIQKDIPLTLHEVPTGTPVFDWTVPKEWNIRDAYVKDATGHKIIDFQQCNLHVVSYSLPIRKRVSLTELKQHLFTLPDHPDWIPYRTAYYKEDWGFCLNHNQLTSLPEGEYEVCIDSELKDGALTYGEYFLPGQTTDEVFISCHVCHPSLCDDNLSGNAVATFLAQALADMPARRYSYRFVFIPGTIGSLTWLARNEAQTKYIKHGMVLTCVGDENRPTYKRSRRGDAEIDRAFLHVLRHAGGDYQAIDFFPYGYDERQYCSPGFNLPVGCFMRGQHGKFPEYHTSADNLQFIKPSILADSFLKCWTVIQLLETNKTYVNLNPKGEPRLGTRGLYSNIGGVDRQAQEMALLWVLNLSDGQHSLLDIAERSDLKYTLIKDAADALTGVGLLKEHM